MQIVIIAKQATSTWFLYETHIRLGKDDCQVSLKSFVGKVLVLIAKVSCYSFLQFEKLLITYKDNLDRGNIHRGHRGLGELSSLMTNSSTGYKPSKKTKVHANPPTKFKFMFIVRLRTV